MNNVFVYIELENGVPADVSLELLTKGRELATTLGVKLEAVVLGHNLGDIAQELAKYGADTVWTADDKEFAPFRTLPHTAVMCGLIEQEKPQIALFGATSIGRDFAPRVSSALFSGLTADCTQLVIGDHKDAKTGTEYENLLYQTPGLRRQHHCDDREPRPPSPDGDRPRGRDAQGVRSQTGCRRGEADRLEEVPERERPGGQDSRPPDRRTQDQYQRRERGGCRRLRRRLEGEFQADSRTGRGAGRRSRRERAAVDAGFTEHARQIGQTGVTIRPKLYIACGISGQIQHTAGMDQSSMIISINTDPDAPINKIADFAITGDLNEVIPKMIKYYKQNSK